MHLHHPSFGPWECAIGGAVIAGSLFIAFGPFRHRIPRVFRVLAKYSVAAKLTVIAIICGAALAHNISNEGDPYSRVGLTTVTLSLLAAAAYLITRKNNV